MEEKIIQKDRKIKDLEESNKKLRASLKKLKVFEIKKNYAKQNQAIGADQNMNYIKTKIKAALITLNFFLNQFGLNIDLVNIGKIDLMARGEETNAREMNDKRKAPFQIVYTNLTAENHSTESTKNTLYYKDLAMLSDKQYLLIRAGWKIKEQVPSLYQIKKFRKLINAEVDSKFKVKAIGNGFYLNPVIQIKSKILDFLKQNYLEMKNNSIIIKLSCDGTNISRNIKLENLVFNLINEGKKAAAVTGCYRLGAFTIFKEDYEELKNWLPKIWEEIKELNKVFFDPINMLIFDEKDIEKTRSSSLLEYDIKLLFTADWKATAIIKGYSAANGRWPCLYCTVDKNGINSLNHKGLCIFLFK
jgi:hypothetical protein